MNALRASVPNTVSTLSIKDSKVPLGSSAPSGPWVKQGGIRHNPVAYTIPDHDEIFLVQFSDRGSTFNVQTMDCGRLGRRRKRSSIDT